jgi:hypothetical protein
MTFTEYEWDEATKKLQPKKKVKLTRDDVRVAADNAAYTIGALSMPLAMFGMLFSGGTFGGANNPFTAMGITPFGIMTGISSLASLGTGLSRLAGGVVDWANMGYWEYGLVYNPQTKMNELKKIKKAKITPTDISSATKNISDVLAALLTPIAQLGALMAGGQAAGMLTSGIAGLFGAGKNPVEQGIKSISGIGTGLSKVAAGVLDWAKMSYWEWGLQFNPKTGMNELKKIGQKKLTKSDITDATKNIGSVLEAMLLPIAGLGAAMAGGQAVGFMTGGLAALFGNAKNPVEQGINAIGTIGKGIANLATGIAGFAKMEIIEQIIQKDPKTGLNVLVPGKVTKLSKDMITTATDNISQILTAGVKAIARFAWQVHLNGGEEQFNKSIETASNLSVKMGEVYKKISAVFSDTKKIQKTTDNWKMFFENLFKPFDADAIARFGEFGTMFGNHIYKIGALTKKYQGMDFALKPQLLWKYKSFTDTTERLAKIADPFTKFVKAFGDMAKHMGVFATNFKVMDVKGIMAFKDWTDSITTISKVDLSKSSAILDFAKGVVDNAFPAGNSKEVGDKPAGSYTETDKKAQIKSQNNKSTDKKITNNTTQDKPGKLEIDYDRLAQAISSALSNISVDTLTVTGRYMPNK